MKKTRIGLSSNMIKIIAILCMLIDHIGMYMYFKLDDTTYYVFRSIGRVVMPIFSYMVVQVFFYTKDLKKYIFRMFSFATITQTVIIILGIINQKYFSNYWTGVTGYFGVLYSYTLSLLLLTVIDKKTIISKLSNNQNAIIRVNIFILIILAYLNLKIEFDFQVPFIILQLYGIEKFFQKNEKLLLSQSRENLCNSIENKGKIVSAEKYALSKLIYYSAIIVCFAISISLIKFAYGFKYTLLFAAFIIMLYNGKKGKNSDIMKWSFYIIFPLQHAIFYFVAMLIH